MRPNIVWITLDSVRADHTSMEGYYRDTTPNIQEISHSGQYFKNTFSVGTGTPVSTASILTGTYPFYHGLRIVNEFLPESLDTVPELLSEVGYTTAGLSRNAYLSAGTGLDRGFDMFRWIAGSNILNSVPPKILAKYLLNLRSHSAGFTWNTAKHATPYLMNGIARRWLQNLRENTPFFFYLHYNEPHHPYYPPLPYLGKYTKNIDMSAKEAARFSLHVHENFREMIANGVEFSDEEWAALKAMYDAEIFYTDKMIGQLYDYISSLNIGETVFVITADHGELFGESDLLSHTIAVHDAVTHVPLVTKGLNEIDTNSDELVQHVDLVRTLLEMTGAKTDQMQGIDLRSAARNRVFVQRQSHDFSIYEDFNQSFDASRFHQEALTALRTKEFKYQKSRDAVKLFKLPNESQEVGEEHPKVVEHLDSELNSWLKETGTTIDTEEDSSLTHAMRDQLRDLGYLE